MLRFSPCKINIGLDVVSKRPDGYHNIVTAMVPVPWHDIIEILPADATALNVIGNAVDCPPEKNLVMKAYRALAQRHPLPPVQIILQKIVPDNAGLGGGSADAATTLLLLNDMFELGCSLEELAEIASTIGADCPFFIYNRPMLCTGTGTEMHPIDLDLHGLHLLIAKPQAERVSTKIAYSRVTPSEPEIPLSELLLLPVCEWQGRIKNDFEKSVFAYAPQCAEVKNIILESGALYAAMSGSGASIFGLFETDKMSHQCQEQLSTMCNCFSATF